VRACVRVCVRACVRACVHIGTFCSSKCIGYAFVRISYLPNVLVHFDMVAACVCRMTYVCMQYTLSTLCKVLILCFVYCSYDAVSSGTPSGSTGKKGETTAPSFLQLVEVQSSQEDSGSVSASFRVCVDNDWEQTDQVDGDANYTSCCGGGGAGHDDEEDDAVIDQSVDAVVDNSVETDQVDGDANYTSCCGGGGGGDGEDDAVVDHGVDAVVNKSTDVVDDNSADAVVYNSIDAADNNSVDDVIDKSVDSVDDSSVDAADDNSGDAVVDSSVDAVDHIDDAVDDHGCGDGRHLCNPQRNMDTHGPKVAAVITVDSSPDSPTATAKPSNSQMSDERTVSAKASTSHMSDRTAVTPKASTSHSYETTVTTKHSTSHMSDRTAVTAKPSNLNVSHKRELAHTQHADDKGSDSVKCGHTEHTGVNLLSYTNIRVRTNQKIYSQPPGETDENDQSKHTNCVESDKSDQTKCHSPRWLRKLDSPGKTASKGAHSPSKTINPGAHPLNYSGTQSPRKINKSGGRGQEKRSQLDVDKDTGSLRSRHERLMVGKGTSADRPGMHDVETTLSKISQFHQQNYTQDTIVLASDDEKVGDYEKVGNDDDTAVDDDDDDVQILNVSREIPADTNGKWLSTSISRYSVKGHSETQQADSSDSSDSSDCENMMQSENYSQKKNKDESRPGYSSWCETLSRSEENSRRRLSDVYAATDSDDTLPPDGHTFEFGDDMKEEVDSYCTSIEDDNEVCIIDSQCTPEKRVPANAASAFELSPGLKQMLDYSPKVIKRSVLIRVNERTKRRSQLSAEALHSRRV
jgi:hypothetical protein